jgi:fucose permease
METAPRPFRRSQHTWLLYLALAIFAIVINVLGPVTPFLKSELHLSYTVTSLLFSAFASGMILTGLAGHLLVKRLGGGTVLWLALFGMCLSAIGLAVSQSPWMTIVASFLMGCIGSLVPSVSSSSLSDEHGENRSAAISESNLIAAASSALAPLLVGWFSYTILGWRFALVIPMIAALALLFGMRSQVRFAGRAEIQAAAHPSSKLPAGYWVFWVMNMLAVAVEYCMLSWCADYLEHVAGLPKPVAAQAISIFLAGMILGRMAGSRLVLRFTSYQVVSGSILVALAGFLLYWSAAATWMAVVGLFMTGLGVANQFPLTLSLAIGASGGNIVRASTQSSLASGIAIFVLPLVLGRLADAYGIHLSYGIVLILLVAAFAIIQAAARRARAPVTDAQSIG